MSSEPSPVDTVFSSAIPSPAKMSTYSAHSSYFTHSNSNNNTVRSLASTTNSDLVVAEAHYLSTLKRVGNALNLSSNQSVAQGRKTSNTIRALIERWTSVMHIHIKFHDDLIAAKEDANSATKLLNGLLVTLEPSLVDHGRDLSNAVYKLTRNDKRTGHKPSEWEAALRNPFDHLTVYNEWLQRIDPQGNFNRECLLQLNGLVVNLKSVIESNQNPRGMLNRISTLARNVIKRPSSGQLLHGNGSAPASQEMTPTSPAMTMVTPILNTAITVTTEYTYINTPPSSRRSLDSSLHAATSENMIETVDDQVNSLTIMQPGENDSEVAASKSEHNITSQLSNDSIDNTHRSSVACSEGSSVGSLTLAASSESLLAKTATTGLTLNGRQLSAASQRQMFIEERESRKATLRSGAASLITAKAESLQNQSLKYKKSQDLEKLHILSSKGSVDSFSTVRRSNADFVSRPSIDRLRIITRREVESKPPVRSLISFWEQTTEIIEV
ncbi:hypothetical protein BGZ76_005650 [Entomortierella beljakovae]|nr:hypothetical protein BGZ76_005650 [Entomortierella beljakovae]